MRKAAGNASRALAGLAKVVSTLGARPTWPRQRRDTCSGAYVFDRYKEPAKAPVGQIVLTVPSQAKPAKDELRRAVITAEAVGLARDLVNTAPNDL